jgi:amino acid transporter
MARKTVWEAHLSLLEPDQSASLRARMGQAQMLEIIGIVIVIAALLVTVVAYVLNIQGSGVMLYLVIIVALLVVGIIMVLVSMSMSDKASKNAKELAIVQHAEFFRQDGEFTDEGLAYLRQ